MAQPPAVGSWSTLSAVSQTFENFTTTITGVRLRAPGTGSTATQGIAGAHIAIPGGTTWDVITRVRNFGALNRTSFGTWGILLYDNISGNMIIFGTGYNEGMAGSVRMTNATTFSGTTLHYLSAATTLAPVQEDHWFKVHVDASNYTFSVSYDGFYWVQAAVESKTAFLAHAANRVGIGMNTNQAVTNECVLECGSWFAG